MKTIKNNISIFEEGDTANKTIIFVHGFPFDHLMWKKQIKEVSNSYHCVTYDVRGLGTSPAGNGQFTVEMFVDDLELIIDEMKLEKPILCGLSMGGYISLRAVERMQQKLGGLILCDTKSQADDNDGKLKRAAAIKIIGEKGVENYIKDFLPNTFTEASIKSLKEYNEIKDRSSGFDPVGIKGCLLAMAGRTDTTEYLSEIKIPTLVICGGEDELTTPQNMREMAAKIPDAEFVIVPNAAHMSPVENPEFFNYTIKKFLTKHFSEK